MSKTVKIIIFLFFFLILFLMAGFVTGVYVSQKFFPKIIEKPIVVKEIIDFQDKGLLEQEIKRVSDKYGLNEKVFYAIIKCEHNKDPQNVNVWEFNKTRDGGYFQINEQTMKRYGGMDLSYLIDPRKAVELAAKIIKTEGLKPWVTRDCIEKELIKK